MRPIHFPFARLEQALSRQSSKGEPLYESPPPLGEQEAKPARKGLASVFAEPHAASTSVVDFGATGRTGRTKVAVRSGRVAVMSGCDCAWTTSLMRVPVWRGLAKWPCLPK